jgi:hypothetical protein
MKGLKSCSQGEIISAIFAYLKTTNKENKFIEEIVQQYRKIGARNEVFI